MNGRVFLMLIYVLLFADQAEIKCMEQVFIREFQWIMMQVRNQQSYLGIQIELHEGHATIVRQVMLIKSYRNMEMLQIRWYRGGKECS